MFQISRWDVAVGEINIAPANMLAALAILLIGLLAVRSAQRWLESQFLPRTGLDAGLQNSIAALTGYSALVAVLALALGALGIDLQKIALIAGALSVGIGFGLQSVVSNFVCGLILLAERPIRVGDWVVVKNEEGWVRRISVRATEIETFDRASVIIPNQDFITGVVKNWTHGNTMGRVVVKVRVAFDSDAEKVREILLACGATASAGSARAGARRLSDRLRRYRPRFRAALPDRQCGAGDGRRNRVAHGCAAPVRPRGGQEFHFRPTMPARPVRTRSPPPLRRPARDGRARRPKAIIF